MKIDQVIEDIDGLISRSGAGFYIEHEDEVEIFDILEDAGLNLEDVIEYL